jgi:signal transduction histidine kinase
VASSATRQLVPPILLSGSAGLLLAIIATLLLSRAFTHPLHDLRKAAEDIAAGNYSRRVAATGGDEVGVVGQAFNRMAEAVERARAQQRAFLANVSHELKTPLTSLIGFSQALMDGSLHTDQEKLRAATILNEEAQRVLRMSQELLDLARVESGQITLNPHPVDLGGQLEQEIEIVRTRAQARSLALQLAVPSTLPPVQADPDRLHQILENLLDNAVKYAPEGTEVRISAEAGPNGAVTAVVRNQVGSPAPDPERMFDRFYRGDPSRSSSAGGVGLGLAISRELAIAQEGSLQAELGAGGSLYLKLALPAVSHPAAPTDPVGATLASPSALGASPRARQASPLHKRAPFV